MKLQIRQEHFLNNLFLNHYYILYLLNILNNYNYQSYFTIL